MQSCAADDDDDDDDYAELPTITLLVYLLRIFALHCAITLK